MTPEQLLRARWYDHVRNADVKGLINNLSQDQYAYLAKQPCYLCGSATQLNGVDRLNSEQGYVEGNCASCCKACNYMKGTMSIDDFMHQCILIADRWKGLLPQWAATHVLPKGPLS